MSPAYEAERLRILDMLEAGTISAGDAIRLLNALSGESEKTAAPTSSPIPADQADAPPSQDETHPSLDPDELPEEFIARQNAFRNWWLYPLAAGAAVIILSGLLMYQGYRTAGYGFWFFCAWVPLLLGLAIVSLALYSRTARWLHVRIQENTSDEPERMALSFPLPLRPAAWFFRNFGRWIPKLEKTGLDELVLALEKNTTPDRPFYVEIQDDETEERVQVFIG